MKLKLLVEAWQDLLERYRDKWRFAWQHRQEFERPQRTAEEAEFLPAALSVQDTPAGPMLHWGLRGIAGFFVFALIASIIFHIDVIVSAEGMVIPSGYVKTIQPLETGVVRRIAVAEGQKINQGDILLELFSPGISTDSGRLTAERDAAKAELARSKLLLDLLSEKGMPSKAYQPIFSGEGHPLVDIRYREYLAKKAKVDAEVIHRSVEVSTAVESLNKVRESIPRLEIKASDYKQLEVDGYVSRHSLLDQVQMLADARAEFAIWTSKILEARSALLEAQHSKELLVSEMRRTVLEQQRDYQNRLDTTQQELAKYKDRDDLMFLRAPIDGVVSNLAVHTVGGVVTAAQTLMSIVPEENALEIEAVLANKDVGHIQNGQLAQIKFESYPFTRYGLLSGRVLGITANSVADEKKGLIYKVRVSLPDQQTRMKDFPHPVIAGMATTVEIKIGNRRVIEYFLSPFITSVSEAAHER